MSTKKQSILLILKILESESDDRHPITKTAIALLISQVYPCDRKTVSRNIATLKALGYPIVTTTRGVYLDRRLFSLEEMHYVRSALTAHTPPEGVDRDEVLHKLFPLLEKLVR